MLTNKRKWEGEVSETYGQKDQELYPTAGREQEEVEYTSKDNQNQQQPNKRQNTGKAYSAGHGEKKYYGGSKPLCPKYNYYQDGPCPPKCHRRGTSQKVIAMNVGINGTTREIAQAKRTKSQKNQIGGTRAQEAGAYPKEEEKPIKT
ncbi:hypothetical protein Tco_1288621 [Tanacetum coccineum]